MMRTQMNNQYNYYQVLLIETTSNRTIVHPYQFLIDQVLEFEELEELSRKNFDIQSVSYTHLTLPTKRIV